VQPVEDVVTFEQFSVDSTPDTPGTTGTNAETPGAVVFAELGTAPARAVFPAFDIATKAVVLAEIGTVPRSVELTAVGMATGNVVFAAIESAVLFSGTGVDIVAMAWRGTGCA